MTRQMMMLRPPSSNRRQPLLTNQTSSVNSRLAEVAGGTAAECAAIACCCPCGLVNLILLAVYKLPVGLCKQALRKKRRQRLMKRGLLPPRRVRCACGCDDTEIQLHPAISDSSSENLVTVPPEKDTEVMKLEKEMWERFYSTGFWRSPSQRE